MSVSIGELEGKWRLLLKITLALFPIATAIGGFAAVKIWSLGTSVAVIEQTAKLNAESIKSINIAVRQNGSNIAVTKQVAQLNATAIRDLTATIASIEARVRKIEGNRYTAADATEKERRDAERFLDVWKQIGTIKERIAMFPTGVSTKWFSDELKTLEDKIDRLADVMNH